MKTNHFFIALAAVVVSLPAASFDVVAEVRLNEPLGQIPMPKWSGGALVTVDKLTGPEITFSIFDRSGARTDRFVFSVPEASTLSLKDYAKADGGTIAIIGSAIASDGRGTTFLAFVPPQNNGPTIVRTGMYTPWRLAFAPDGTLWTAGYELTPKQPGSKRTFIEALNADAFAIRHFSSSGVLLGQQLRQNEARDTLDLLSTTQALFKIVENTIYWYEGQSGKLLLASDSQPFQLLDFGRQPQGSLETSGAISNAGDIYASVVDKTTWSVTHRAAKSPASKEVLGARLLGDKSNRDSRLTFVGADQSLLVSLSADGRSIRFVRLSD